MKAKRRTVRKAPSKTSRRKALGARPPAGKTRRPAPLLTPEQQIVGAVFLGKVMNYFSHLGVATLALEAPVALGDMVRIKGHTTDLTQKVDSLQIGHQNVQSASQGEGVGIKVADKVRVGDAVFKV